MGNALISETHGPVTLIRLSHGKVNAMDLEMLREWIDALESLADGASRAAVVTGAGSVFSAGVDLRRLMTGGPAYIEEFLPLMGEAFLKTFSLAKPLVAAVNGHAVAGGCILACACDYRVMSEGDGRIGTPELRVGVPFPTVAMEILRLTLPAHRLQALVYGGLSCRPDEALANGFVDEVVPEAALTDRALEVAGRLGSLPTTSFALTKRVIRQPSRERIEAQMSSVDAEVFAAWTSSEVLAAIQAYVDRTLKK